MENRRDFLSKLALVTSSTLIPWNAFSQTKDQLGEVLPMRKLGKTGVQVTMLGVGGYHVGWTSEKDAQEVIETALELGIRFFDTAHSYGKGKSETRYGKYLVPKYRDNIFLMTKSTAKTYAAAKLELEESLKRLNTEQVDLWQIHSLESPSDVNNRINNGVLKAVEEALAEGKIKFAGFTGHKDPDAILEMLNQTQDSGLFSTAQMPINLIDANRNLSFTNTVLPQLLDQGLGVLAMKTLADGRFFNKKQMMEKVIWESTNPVIPNYISIEEALLFAWSLPISTLITGAENARFLKEKVEFAKRMININENHRIILVQKLSDYIQKQDVEYYKRKS